MPLSLICASHTPLIDRIRIAPELDAKVRQAYLQLTKHMLAFDPELIVQFAPDHYHGFFHRLMPSFCIGTSARSAADWNISPGDINVPTTDAEALARWLIEHDFDIAVSRDMIIDHGFLQLWQEMLGSFQDLPIIPVFVNCIAPPLASYRRTRMLGEAVGRFALQSGKRVLIVASGGLSHDPPVPNIYQVPDELKARLVQGTARTAEEKKAHEANLTEFGRQAGKGEGPCNALNPQWDKAFLDIIASGELSKFDRFTEAGVRDEAGRAANEVLAWVAASSAFAVAGPYDMNVEMYHPIPEWIAGMAMITATTQ